MPQIQNPNLNRDFRYCNGSISGVINISVYTIAITLNAKGKPDGTFYISLTPIDLYGLHSIRMVLQSIQEMIQCIHGL